MLDVTSDAMLVPSYLRDVYSWAYLTPRLAGWFDRQIVVQTILWGNAQRLIDDVLATGGTAAAATRLVERLGGVTIGAGFLIELTFLGGRGKLGGYDAVSLINYV